MAIVALIGQRRFRILKMLKFCMYPERIDCFFNPVGIHGKLEIGYKFDKNDKIVYEASIFIDNRLFSTDLVYFNENYTELIDYVSDRVLVQFDILDN